MSAAAPHMVVVNQRLLGRNEQQATANRMLFRDHGVLVVNLLSSPGSGKTALLERTLAYLAHRLPAAVIVGDLSTDNDARRLQRTGVETVQVTTGSVCHLDAAMIAEAVGRLNLSRVQILFVENVGNLVCPASYDLGESLRVVLLSVTEGEDKPLKYPKAFKTADLVVITKIDLAQATGFDRATTLANVRAIAPQATILELSARTGEGMAGWYDLLDRRLAGVIGP